MKSLQFLSLLHLVARSTTTFQTDSNSYEVACHNDPFYHLALDTPPTCTLSPKPAINDPTPEILSFEEWKAARQIAHESGLPKPNADSETASQHLNKPLSEEDERLQASTHPDGSQVPADESTNGRTHLQEANGNPVRVPLKDRFNYASQDCTARIHSSHRGAKSPSAILSSKKDRYMLSPCNSKHKFVVVELCDDIRIDTVQLANFEFFSGVFKDVKISLADSAPGDPLSWTDAGTYHAKNIRGVQSFHPNQGRQKFWRYIRIDFISHYGNEFYCPVSLLRVYGLTHMEDYKWAGWQSDKESQGQINRAEEMVPLPVSSKQDIHSTKILEPHQLISGAALSPSSLHAPPLAIMPRTDFSAVDHASMSTTITSTSGGPTYGTKVAELVGSDGLKSESDVMDSSLPLYPGEAATKPGDAEASLYSEESSTGDQSELGPSPATPETRNPATSHQPPSSTTSSNASSSPAVVPISTHVIQTGGESIYRTIMNRLHGLEMNSTLGIRYVEEQTRSIRDVVRKLEEDVGRLDELGKRQQRLLERAILQMEQQRRETDSEIRKLATDVQTLTREVTLEKRLGFLQLCLLICAFIFMGLTRGSRDQNFAQSTAPGDTRRLDMVPADSTRPRSSKVSQDVRGGRAHSYLYPRTSPRSQVSFHTKRPSVGDPFDETTGIDAGSYRFPPHPTHVHHSSISRLNRHARQRVISSPALPVQMRHSSPRRMAPHLHEVKPTEQSRRRLQIDLGQDGDEGETPKGRRTLPMQGHAIPLQFGHVTDQPHSKSYGQMHDRETSPSSTAAGDDISSDEGGVWEDTSTEGGDEETMSADGRTPCVAESTSPLDPNLVSVRYESSPSVETLRLGSP